MIIPNDNRQRRSAYPKAVISRKTPVSESFLVKLQAQAYNFIKKETFAQVLSCKF